MTLRVDGVWDIECASWDRFRVGHLRSIDGRDAFTSWDEDDFAREMLSRRGHWYAHAGGRYDALWLLGWAARRQIPWSARMRGSGVLSARIGDLEICDSYAVVPMSLRKAAPMGGSRKTSPGLPCECGRACGGFCALSRELTAAERAAVEAYVENDCVVLASVLEAVASECAALGIDLGRTIGGSGWRTAKAWCGLYDAPDELDLYAALREGYFGGRVEVYRRWAARGGRWDIHSSYPAALVRTAVPVGVPRHVTGRAASAAYRAGKEGIFAAALTVPECHSPPLPVRAAERLLYPWGPIRGTWTALELRHAEECGARIESVSSGYAYEASERLLAPFCERVWGYRASAIARGQDSWSTFFKLLANSLTGKFASRPGHTSLRFVSLTQPLPDRCDVVRQSAEGDFVVIPAPRRVDPCAHVQWAAYLTASARIELHHQLLHAGDAAVYCDTDSCYSTRELTRRIGDELGEWGHEGDMVRWRALAPKVYRYHIGGEPHVRGKGFPSLTSDGFDALARGEGWSTESGVDGLRTSLRRGGALFSRRELTRQLHPVPGWVGGRRLRSASSPLTSAPTVAEYETR